MNLNKELEKYEQQQITDDYYCLTCGKNTSMCDHCLVCGELDNDCYCVSTLTCPNCELGSDMCIC